MPGDIIARQRGFKWKSGENVIVGKDHTIHAKVEGIVHFRESKYRKVPYKIIDVIATQLPNRMMKHPAPYMYHPELFPERAKLNHPSMRFVDKKKVTFDGIEQETQLKPWFFSPLQYWNIMINSMILGRID